MKNYKEKYLSNLKWNRWDYPISLSFIIIAGLIFTEGTGFIRLIGIIPLGLFAFLIFRFVQNEQEIKELKEVE